MANRRCISKDLYESSGFGELSPISKVLYTQFILHSDDDGVVINPKIVMLIAKAKQKHLDELLLKNFLIYIDGIFVVKHWFLHNKVQPARKHDSIYQKELSKLIVNKHKEYEVFDDKLSTICRPNLTKPNLTKLNSSQVNSNEVNSSEKKSTELSQRELSDSDSGINHFIGFDGNESVNSSDSKDLEEFKRSCREAVERVRRLY